MSADDVIPPSPQHRDAEVLQHVLREVRTGRPLDEVMQDPYVEERQEADTHAKVLDDATGGAGHAAAGDVAPDAGVDSELLAELRKIDETP